MRDLQKPFVFFVSAIHLTDRWKLLTTHLCFLIDLLEKDFDLLPGSPAVLSRAVSGGSGFVEPREEQGVLGDPLDRNHEERVEIHASQERVLHLRDFEEDPKQLFLLLQLLQEN